MKAVVLARGKGTRMQRLAAGSSATLEQARVADTGVKAMIPFGRPFLDFVLDALASAGCRDICLVIGPEHDAVREYYERTCVPERVRVTFAVQREARGTADAVLAAHAFAGDDPFLSLNADNLYPIEALQPLAALDGPGLAAFRRAALLERSNIDPDRLRGYALVTIDDRGDLIDIVEKPDAETLTRHGAGAAISMNCWRFDASIFEACRRIEPSPRGELELPNAVRYAINVLGTRFRAVPVDAGVLDLSKREDIAGIEHRLAHVDPRP
jgi:glucose-1-phosphate thymidylyltransferase